MQHWNADSIRNYVLIYYDYGGHLGYHLDYFYNVGITINHAAHNIR